MTKRPSWFFAICGAIIIESLVCTMVHHFGRIGGDGPNFWGAVGLITELPGAVVAERLFGVTSPMVVVLGYLSGLGLFFLLFWAALAVVRRLFLGISAEPGASGNSRPAV